ncbi:MAG: pyridoxamine 5'-phosphate oxidase family protein [Halovenus sp.]
MTTEELAEYGIESMDGRAVADFVEAQNSGVLGLPGPEPYLVPLSYGYDGESLFFSFLEGEESKKGRLAREAERAAFLIYTAESAFTWESVLLAGPLREKPADEWDHALDVLDEAWRPAVLEDAQMAADVRVFELAVDEQSGLRHAGLPPGMRQ